MNRFSCLIIALALISCKEETEQSLSGNWFFQNDQFGYCEAYFTSGELAIYTEELGLITEEKYSLENDTIYYFLNEQKYPSSLLRYMSKDSLVLTDIKAQTMYKMKKMKDFEIGYFQIENDSLILQLTEMNANKRQSVHYVETGQMDKVLFDSLEKTGYWTEEKWIRE